ncbi:MAG: beta-ketoacyl-ACP synthase [Coleofasciculaceae cyanobacterium]
MSLKVVVTGLGLVSALGSLESSWRSLIDGKSAIRQHKPFADLPSLPLGLIGGTTSLEKLTQLAVSDAVQDAGLATQAPNCGVVVGSSRGCQAAWEYLAGVLREGAKEQGRKINLLTPSLPDQETSLGGWLETLPHQAAITAARQVKSNGPVLAPMAACATGIWAIAQGFELIKTGQCQRVIAGAVEAPITQLTLAGFDKIGVLAKTGAYPFDRQREGLVLGEGAAILVLESAESALARGASVYGQLLGFGLTCDAYHVSTPNRDHHSAAMAVKQCLERSKLHHADIDYIHAHGTSTKLNDDNEAQLIQKLFTQGVPVSSTKGATGHTLGASGAIGAVFSMMALKHQLLPPCVGLRETEFNLDLVTTPRQAQVRHLLCFSFGFGGQNAVLAMAK